MDLRRQKLITHIYLSMRVALGYLRHVSSYLMYSKDHQLVALRTRQSLSGTSSPDHRVLVDVVSVHPSAAMALRAAL